jgi:RNA polymerase sigma factor (sigma-70 family)
MSAPANELMDEDLIALFKEEHTREKAFTQIVQRYQERLYWHIRRMVVNHEDADDVLQNTFIKVWKGLDGFRQESSLYTWLYRIATNETYTFLEKLKKKRAVSYSDREESFGNMLQAEKGFDFKKLEWKLQMAIQQLPEKQREVFLLRYYDEMPYEKMAEVLDKSVGTLKATYHFAAKKVEEYLKQN